MAIAEVSTQPPDRALRGWLMFWLGAFVLGIDQLSRWAALRFLGRNMATNSHSLLHLGLRYDYGNIVNNNPMPAALVNSEYATMFVAAVVIGLVMSKRTVRIGVGLVLGGMVSNWLSLAFGMHAIVDFIGVFRGQLVFNVADMSIVAGVVIILSGTLLSVRQRVTGVIPSKDRSGSVWLVPPGKREESPAIVKMPGTLWVLLGERGGECQHSTEGCTDC